MFITHCSQPLHAKLFLIVKQFTPVVFLDNQKRIINVVKTQLFLSNNNNLRVNLHR